MKILVTGGAGFLGLHICKALALNQYDVCAVDNLIHGHADRVKWGSLKVGDIGDAKIMDDVFREFAPDTVIHLAAYTNPLESIKNPRAYYHNNVTATMVLLDTMQRHSVKNIIFASTSTVYAEKPSLDLYHEQDKCRPSNPYSISKWVSEQIITDYASAYGLRYIIMRHFNPSGAESGGDLGELPSNNNHAIPALVQVALGIKPVFTLYGTDYATPDGTSIRDYVHVTDIAEAHLCALRYLSAGKDSLITNIGTGQGTSLKQVIAAVEKKCGHSLPVDYKPRRHIHQAYLVADSLTARKCLGWVPCHSSLDNIIETTFRWFITYASPSHAAAL